MRFKRKDLTNTHPHGKFHCNETSRIGIARISKNGSSTLQKTFELNKWLPFIESDKYLVYCVIRSPHDRFFSSIPETLKRYSYKQDSSSDVLVAHEVFEALNRLESKSIVGLLNSFIDLIDNFSFFDAHHEPQVNFLFDEKGQYLINPYVGSLGDIQILTQYHNYILKNANRRFETSLIKKMYASVKLGMLYTNSTFFWNSVQTQNPLFRLYGLKTTNNVTHAKALLSKRLYKDILNLSSWQKKQIFKRVKKHYLGDGELHKLSTDSKFQIKLSDMVN